MISNSWETINAKLQYEKHLQETSGTNSPVQTNVKQNVINDSVQRREFYQNSNSNSNSNVNTQSGGALKPSSSGGKIADLQTTFGEMINSAPAAFSPQFTRKYYRIHAVSAANSSSGGNGSNNSPSEGGGEHSCNNNIKTLSSTSGADGDVEEEGEFSPKQRSEDGRMNSGGSGSESYHSSEGGGGGGGAAGRGGAWKKANKYSPEKAPKSVFIKPFGDSCNHTTAAKSSSSSSSLMQQQEGQGEGEIELCK